MDQEAPEYLSWHSADRSRTVRFEHDVIRRIHVEIMRGYGVTRRRGTEPGGLLLGRSDDGAIVIDGFEMVPCEYAFGPSYVLSSHDEGEFAAAVSRAGVTAVGYFRSHTRDGLSPDQADSDLFAKFFGPAGLVALLLKPYATKPASASLFFPVNGGRLVAGESSHEFPFSTKLESVVAEPQPIPVAEPEPLPTSPPLPPAAVAVGTATAPVVIPPAPETDKLLTGVLGLRGTPRVPMDASGTSVERVPSEVRKQRDFLTLVMAILFTAVALGTGFIAGFQLAGGHVSVNPPGISPPDGKTPFILGLRTQMAGERVRVSWATDSPAALRALGGTLYIRDGSDTRLVRLQPGEVRDGMLLHLPQTGTVQFRLELNLPGDRTVTETVGWTR